MSDNWAIRTNSHRMRVAAGMAAVITLAYAGPAYAFDAAADEIIQQTCRAIKVTQNVLVTSAVLALIIGLAPMLWGQVKVKWIISSLVACTLFGLAPSMVLAFASNAQGCK